MRKQGAALTAPRCWTVEETTRKLRFRSVADDPTAIRLAFFQSGLSLSQAKRLSMHHVPGYRRRRQTIEREQGGECAIEQRYRQYSSCGQCREIAVRAMIRADFLAALADRLLEEFLVHGQNWKYRKECTADICVKVKTRRQPNAAPCSG